ncbi:unnamed protein product [Adineta steineri]|uniref:Apple domain-containing protein n=1 Tax=Adineta steineri TaxID=433720 RepID=A0A814IE42_9BILA|nr:unnamed protein product [Adineta steineri]CAF1022225.1 unnamed protein product [Adineta steineri]CAF3944973.1 unnamed protein product [Adineta steineri]CAF4042984.1 unnamed protein product [Adineta steineri]
MTSSCYILLVVALVVVANARDLSRFEQLARRVLQDSDEGMVDNFKLRTHKRKHMDNSEEGFYVFNKRGDTGSWTKIGSDQAIPDSECPNMELAFGTDLKTCEEYCTETVGCNAFNVQPQAHGSCVLRQCDGFPTVVNPYKGYDAYGMKDNGKWVRIATESAITDDVCDPTSIIYGKNTAECQQICESRSSCTAFNMEIYGKQCVLRNCKTDSPKAQAKANYDVWVWKKS